MEPDFFDLFIECVPSMTPAQQIVLKNALQGNFPAVFPLGGVVPPFPDIIGDDPRSRRLSKAYGFMPGDRVRIVGNINPKYLLGMTGSIINDGKTIRAGTKQVRMSVKFDKAIGRFKALSPIGVPVECLEKIP